MNVALKLAAATEAATGLMLVAYPPLVARLLFGAGVTGVAGVVSGFAGVPLRALSLR